MIVSDGGYAHTYMDVHTHRHAGTHTHTLTIMYAYMHTQTHRQFNYFSLSVCLCLFLSHTPELVSFLSSEPGYYEDGLFGIRIENVVLVVPAKPKVRN